MAPTDIAVHHGPDGTTLKGYGPLELNNFHYDTANTVKIPPVDPSAVASLKTTVRGLNAEPYTLIAGPQSWKASELQGKANYYKWQYHLSEADVAEIEAALDQLKAKGGSIEDLKSKEDFPLPTTLQPSLRLRMPRRVGSVVGPLYNELLRRGRKDLVEVLVLEQCKWGDPADTWAKEGYERKRDPGHQWSNRTPFLFYNGYLSVNFKEGAYYYYYKFPEAPRFSALEEEALRTFTALAKSDELRLDWKLEPGDIPASNNLMMLHSKTTFKDYEDPAKARHLLRLWVSPPNGIPLPPDSYYAKAWGSVEIGHRGGYHLGKDYVKKLPLETEYGDLDALDPAKNKK